MVTCTGQRIPCFDRCQLAIICMSNIKEGRYKPRVHVSVSLLAGVWPPSCTTPSSSSSSSTRPRAIPLAMITMIINSVFFPTWVWAPLGDASTTMRRNANKKLRVHNRLKNKECFPLGKDRKCKTDPVYMHLRGQLSISSHKQRYLWNFIRIKH